MIATAIPKSPTKRKICENNFDLCQKSRAKVPDREISVRYIQARCVANDYEAVRWLINLSHARHELPFVFRRFWEVDFDQALRIFLCTFELPDFIR